MNVPIIDVYGGLDSLWDDFDVPKCATNWVFFPNPLESKILGFQRGKSMVNLVTQPYVGGIDALDGSQMEAERAEDGSGVELVVRGRKAGVPVTSPEHSDHEVLQKWGFVMETTEEFHPGFILCLRITIPQGVLVP
ncbi:hypothetical protein BDK51DRAFT_32699 [Blyttiomyces helicus]|uniref:Uncharacterized protein n=1 Tax=Blyttiomyces helicus TaxID=388810 RepID=A0A4V1ISU9_9FUNG|nr:hypothetical protein BDK51DRAFT_32699 [Blyttiomyces helicus]|eukprot:RKO94817.1 hypothetical protein BDK51DRAFT_32699 [Blyttiomyces helicus]